MYKIKVRPKFEPGDRENSKNDETFTDCKQINTLQKVTNRGA